MDTPDTLASALRATRKKRNLTQEALAAEVGVSRSHIAMIETGGDLPGRETLVALLTYLDLPLDLIAAGHTNANPSTTARAETEQEALWLHGFRTMDKAERDALLSYVLSRVRTSGS